MCVIRWFLPDMWKCLGMRLSSSVRKGTPSDWLLQRSCKSGVDNNVHCFLSLCRCCCSETVVYMCLQIEFVYVFVLLY